MEESALRDKISSVFQDIYSSHVDGATAIELHDDSVLLDTGLDSLGFAILIARLEEELEYDPFTISTEAYYPTTFADFVEFYHKNQPA